MSFIHLPALLREVDPLAQRFRDAGHRLFLVGGIVRDLWLDRAVNASSDIDLTTDARPAQTRAVLEGWADVIWTQGERFGTIGCRHRGRAYEITTHRADAYAPDSRKPIVAFGDDITDDLSRRDFTVNAMAWEVPDGHLIDPFNGAEDLAAQRLTTPQSPEVSFTDDPLRMIRAARFANTYQLTPTPEVLATAHRLRERLDIVAIERIRDELDKMFRSPDVTRGLDVLRETGLLDRIVSDADDRSVAVAAAVPPPWWLRIAGLLAPLATTREALDPRLAALRLSRDDSAAIRATVLTAHAMVMHGDHGAPADEQIRRWAFDSRGHMSEALALAEALVGGERVEPVRARYVELAATEDLADDSSPLSGTEIASILGVDPGPAVGAAVAALRKERFRRGPLSADDARAHLEQLGSADAGAGSFAGEEPGGG